jgi:hypothetical protein
MGASADWRPKQKELRHSPDDDAARASFALHGATLDQQRGICKKQNAIKPNFRGQLTKHGLGFLTAIGETPLGLSKNDTRQAGMVKRDR